MFKYDRKLITTGLVAILISSVSAFGYEGKKDALDGGMTYPRVNGDYTAYKINENIDKVKINNGRTPTANELKAWDRDIMPDGTGLPDGEGSVEDGDELYESLCAVCHGDFGAGGVGYPTLTGGDISSLTNQRTVPGKDAPKRTIGTYWPQASTLIWYTRDAMPYAHPKSLTNNELYAITAYLLAANGIKVDGQEMDDEFVLSKENFLKIEMPNKDGFYPDIDGKDGIENVRKFFADGKNYGAVGKRCMSNCKDPGMEDVEATVMGIDYELTDVKPPYNNTRNLPKVKKTNSHPGKEGYDKNCAVCHATDTMGAPRLGDSEAWAKITKQGLQKTMIHTIEGIGGMPPKGGNKDLTEWQIQLILDYMISNSK